jgi:hypothetical protein
MRSVSYLEGKDAARESIIWFAYREVQKKAGCALRIVADGTGRWRQC